MSTIDGGSVMVGLLLLWVRLRDQQGQLKFDHNSTVACLFTVVEEVTFSQNVLLAEASRSHNSPYISQGFSSTIELHRRNADPRPLHEP